MSKASNPYGDGTASKQIVDAIINKYNYIFSQSTKRT